MIGHALIMENTDPVKHIFSQRPIGTRVARRPKIRLIDRVEDDISKEGIKTGRGGHRIEWNGGDISGRPRPIPSCATIDD